MYEFTHQGWWFKWSLLDKVSKRLAAVSLVAAGLAVTPATVDLSLQSDHVGKILGSGRGSLSEMALQPWEAWWLVGFGIVSGLFWWRFSLRQDEMFNRVQNWSLGMSGAWTSTLASMWGVLAFGDVVPALPMLAVFGIFYVALVGFWTIAVRRWA